MIVKANVVPVRVKRLYELSEKLLGVEPERLKEVLLLDSPGVQSTWVVGFRRAEQAARIWSRFLNKLEELLANIVSVLSMLSSRGRLDPYEALDIVADVISYTLKWPLYGYNAVYTDVLAPHIGFIAYKLLRCVCREYVEKTDPLMVYQAVYKWIVYREPDVRELCGVEDEELFRMLSKVGAVLSTLAGLGREGLELQELLEFSLYALPADTRPGLNVSGLNLHLLLSSAIASAIVGDDRSLRPIVRVAALLHDIGKPINYKEHVNASVNVAKKLLSKIAEVNDELRHLVNVVLELIETHHDERKCLEKLTPLLGDSAKKACTALIKGDRFSAGADRLVELLVKAYECQDSEDKLCTLLKQHGVVEVVKKFVSVLEKELEEKFKKRFSGRDAIEVAYGRKHLKHPERKLVWDVWESLWAKESKLLSEVSAAIARILFVSSPQLLGLREEEPSKAETEILVVDIGGIQASLKETLKLRTLAGVSLAIDYLTYVAVPLAIEEVLGAPLESVVFAGGGTLHVITRVLEEQDIRRVVESLGERATRGLLGVILPGVNIRVGAAKIDFNMPFGYAMAVSRAYSRIDLEKSTVKTVNGYVGGVTLYRYTEPCAYCYSRPAHIRLDGEPVCLVCLARYEVSKLMGYSVRLERFKARLEGLDKRVLERISAYIEDPLRLLALPYRDCIAVVKADGNVMGVVMSSSLIPSAFYEKSVRVDLALRRGLHTAMEKLEEMLGGRLTDERRVIAILSALTLSMLYAGGDDLLLILPAGLALPFTMLFSYIFGAELGFLITVSAGIAAGPRHQPIWWLLEAADKLLEEAKSMARDKVIESFLNIKPFNGVAVIGYDYSRRALTAARVLQRLHERLAPLTLLPTNKDPERSLLHIAAAVVGKHVEHARVPSTVEEDKALEEFLKSLLEDSIEAVKASESIREVNRRLTACETIERLPFALLEEGVEKAKAKPIYKLILEVSSKKVKLLPMLLYEFYIVSKLMGG